MTGRSTYTLCPIHALSSYYSHMIVFWEISVCRELRIFSDGSADSSWLCGVIHRLWGNRLCPLDGTRSIASSTKLWRGVLLEDIAWLLYALPSLPLCFISYRCDIWLSHSVLSATSMGAPSGSDLHTQVTFSFSLEGMWLGCGTPT